MFNHIVNTIRFKSINLNVKWSKDADKAAKIWQLLDLGLRRIDNGLDIMDIDKGTYDGLIMMMMHNAYVSSGLHKF